MNQSNGNLSNFNIAEIYHDFATTPKLQSETVNTGVMIPANSLIIGLKAIGSADLDGPGSTLMKIKCGNVDVTSDLDIAGEWANTAAGFNFDTSLGAGSGALVLISTTGELKFVLSAAGGGANAGSLRVFVEYVALRV